MHYEPFLALATANIIFKNFQLQWGHFFKTDDSDGVDDDAAVASGAAERRDSAHRDCAIEKNGAVRLFCLFI